MRRRPHRVLFVSLLIIVFLGLLELSSRLFYEDITPRVGRFVVAVLMSEAAPFQRDLDEALLPRLVSHPYLLYEASPNWRNDQGNQHNSLGYRGPDFAFEKPQDTIRILALGGSTTYGWGVERPEDTWPLQLEAILDERGKDRFQVINGGLPNATSAELLSGYVFKHRFLKPDVVIIHAGGNDVLPLMFPDYNPEYTHFRAAAETSPRRFERFILKAFGTIRLVYAWWLRGEPIGTFVAQPYAVKEMDPNEALKRVESTAPVGFQRNIDYLVRASLRDGARVLIVGFVQAKKEFLTVNRPDLAGFEESLVVGLEKNLDVLNEIAKDNDVP